MSEVQQEKEQTKAEILLFKLQFMGLMMASGRQEDVDELSFFPGMDVRASKKIEIVSDVLTLMSEHFELRTVKKHAESANSNLRILEPGRSAV